MSALNALRRADMTTEERRTLDTFLKDEHLGLDDVFIYRESGHAVVSYDTPEGQSSYYDVTDGIDL